jgi:hypothetical protein
VRHTPTIAVVALLLVSGCTIEPTPREYFDHLLPIEAERENTADEVRARVRAFGAALARGDAADASGALAPAAGVHVVGPVEGELRLGAGEIEVLLHYLAGEQPAEVAVDDVQVWVGPRATVAWFAAHFQVGGARPGGWYLTGVYAREEGTLRLVQAHLSAARTPQLARPYPAGDAAPAAGAGAAAPRSSDAGAP